MICWCIFQGWNPTQLYRDLPRHYKDPIMNQSVFHAISFQGFVAVAQLRSNRGHEQWHTYFGKIKQAANVPWKNSAWILGWCHIMTACVGKKTGSTHYPYWDLVGDESFIFFWNLPGFSWIYLPETNQLGGENGSNRNYLVSWVISPYLGDLC